LQELKGSKGGQLSGGEQQMLAIARALIPDHDLLLIDEPTEGLAPQIAGDVSETIRELTQDATILLVAQSMDLVFDVSDRVYGMVDGEIVYEGSPEDARESEIAKDILTI
jgi:branched-chain amino acid transport system ATP-binding protein